MDKLSTKFCKSCEGGDLLPMSKEEINLSLQKEIPNWRVDSTEKQFIFRVFEFKNYYQTMAFVNAVAWIAHLENHHPELEVSYKQCTVKYWTHAIGGLSLNDFICAAKIDILVQDF